MFERLATIARHERYALCMLAIAIPAALGCYVAAALSAPAQTVQTATVEPSHGVDYILGNTIIEAFDSKGNRYVAGVGAGCDNAKIGAIYPADMVASRCVFVRTFN